MNIIYNNYNTDEILGYEKNGEYKYQSAMRDFYGINLPFICDIDNNIWMPVKEVCKYLKLTKSQTNTEKNRMNKDFFLRTQSKMLDVIYCKNDNKVLSNKTICIAADSFCPWILKMDLPSLNDYAYSVIRSVINKAVGSNIIPKERNIPKDIFHKEKMLQNKIKSMGEINNIKIIDEEVRYNFGRIDLLGVDGLGKRVCIELKKDGEFDDTKEQLLRYKNSDKFDRVIYIAHKISGDLLSFMKMNSIESLTYKICPNGSLEFDNL